MKHLLFCLALFPSIASAQAIGCFSLNSNPAICYSGVLSCSTDPAVNAYNYGAAAGDLCDRVAAAAILLDQYYAEKENCRNSYASYILQTDAIVAKLRRQIKQLKKRR